MSGRPEDFHVICQQNVCGLGVSGNGRRYVTQHLSVHNRPVPGTANAASPAFQSRRLLASLQKEQLHQPRTMIGESLFILGDNAQAYLCSYTTAFALFDALWKVW